jgi:hypothetical protein
LIDRLQRSDVERTMMHASVDSACDESRPLEHLDVARHGRERHPERLGELRHGGRRVSRQTRQHGPPRLVAEGAEDEIETIAG